jgi:hypothetical protein
VEDGFFIDMANIVVAGNADGGARILTKPQ